MEDGADDDNGVVGRCASIPVSVPVTVPSCPLFCNWSWSIKWLIVNYFDTIYEWKVFPTWDKKGYRAERWSINEWTTRINNQSNSKIDWLIGLRKSNERWWRFLVLSEEHHLHLKICKMKSERWKSEGFIHSHDRCLHSTWVDTKWQSNSLYDTHHKSQILWVPPSYIPEYTKRLLKYWINLESNVYSTRTILVSTIQVESENNPFEKYAFPSILFYLIPFISSSANLKQLNVDTHSITDSLSHTFFMCFLLFVGEFYHLPS